MRLQWPAGMGRASAEGEIEQPTGDTDDAFFVGSLIAIVPVVYLLIRTLARERSAQLVVCKSPKASRSWACKLNIWFQSYGDFGLDLPNGP